MIKKINIQNFRNLSDINLELNNQSLLIHGNNAQGKTNLLEAIFTLAVGRSFRTRRHNEIYGPKGDFFRISIDLEKNDKTTILIHSSEQKTKLTYKKIFKKDGKELKPQDFIGQFNAVLFTPENLNILSDQPKGRRMFLDITLCQSIPGYLITLTEFKKALKQRKAVLNSLDFKNPNLEELTPWNTKVIELSLEIQKQRQSLVDNYNKSIQDTYRKISDNEDLIDMIYRPSILTEEALALVLDKDIRFQKTSLGAHLDDFSIILNKRDMKNFGSQGEHRSTIVALKVCELEYLKETNNQTPFLFLDDVLSELDTDRQKSLITLVKEYPSIITTTTTELFGNYSNLDIMHMQNGQII